MHRIPVDRRIVFINQSAGYLTIDIINQFLEAGHKCDLITGLLVERNRSIGEAVKVRNIIRYNNTTQIRRIITWGYATIQIFFIALFKYRNAHLFFFTNPPSAILTTILLPNSYSLLIFDVYPEAITELGVLKRSSLIIKLWKSANRLIYRRASDIFTITEGMRELISSYPTKKPIEVVNLWADSEFLHRLPNEKNPFIAKYGLTGKFIVLYSGKIGYTSDVEVLCDVANTIDNDEVRFVIIGDGARRKQIDERIISSGLKTITLLPWQDVSLLPFTLSAADIGVVILSKAASRLSIPSKTFSLLAMGTPVLGIAGDDSDLNIMINHYHIGKCFLPEDINGIVQFINALEKDRKTCSELNDNALTASRFFTRKNAEKFVFIHE